MSAGDYRPPTSEAMAARQATDPALRLLLAQRRIYKSSKRWAALRIIGISVVAVAAPIITAFAPSLAVVVAAVAATWLFLARTWFFTRERSLAAKGALVQELFDHEVFGMPEVSGRVPRLTLEEIAEWAGPPEAMANAVVKERLADWYPLQGSLPGQLSVAIAQRANAVYSERLYRANANVWVGLVVFWAVLSIGGSMLLNFSLTTFMLGVALPLLPAMLDVYEQWRITRRAGIERRALGETIESAIRGRDGDAVTPSKLLAWQDQLFALRRDAPLVPELVYGRTRSNNEGLMQAAATELAAVAGNRAVPPEEPEANRG